MASGRLNGEIERRAHEEAIQHSDFVRCGWLFCRGFLSYINSFLQGAVITISNQTAFLYEISGWI